MSVNIQTLSDLDNAIKEQRQENNIAQSNVQEKDYLSNGFMFDGESFDKLPLEIKETILNYT